MVQVFYPTCHVTALKRINQVAQMMKARLVFEWLMPKFCFFLKTGVCYMWWWWPMMKHDDKCVSGSIRSQGCSGSRPTTRRSMGRWCTARRGSTRRVSSWRYRDSHRISEYANQKCLADGQQIQPHKDIEAIGWQSGLKLSLSSKRQIMYYQITSVIEILAVDVRITSVEEMANSFYLLRHLLKKFFWEWNKKTY